MNVAVLGVGGRGQAIAGRCVAAGHDVHLYGTDANTVMDSIDEIEQETGADRDPVGDIEGTTDLEAGVDGATAVVDATDDDLAGRRALVARAEEFIDDRTLVATTDPGTPVSAVAAGLRNPGRAVGLHPLDGAAVAEVVAADQTTSEALDRAVEFVEAIDCTPLVVRDAPGFVVTRLDLALVAEAVRIVDDGIASIADIDRALEGGRGHDYGPLALADRLGLDRALTALEDLSDELGDRFDPPDLLREKVERGDLGVETGTGFYHWDGGDRDEPAEPDPTVSARDDVETDPANR